jgi:hypothetical protein
MKFRESATSIEEVGVAIAANRATRDIVVSEAILRQRERQNDDQRARNLV